jgi:hypothetical protein
MTGLGVMATAEHTLSFDEASHEYRLDGLPVVSVTQALDLAGLMNWKRFVPADVLDFASERGRAVHSALHFYDENALDWSTVDPAIRGYIEAYERFASAKDWTPVMIEQPLYHASLRYAGRPDRIGVLDGDKCVLDLKSGVVNEVVALQLAGYAGLLAAPAAYRRFGLQLRADGKYRLSEYPRADYRFDFSVFASALNVAQFKRLKGIQ